MRRNWASCASFVNQWQIQSFPGFQPSGYSTIGNTGYSRGAFNSWGQRASITWVKGSHTLKFGGDYRVQQMNQFFFTTIVPRFSFTNQMTAQNPLSPDANNGNPIASFLLGYASPPMSSNPNLSQISGAICSSSSRTTGR